MLVPGVSGDIDGAGTDDAEMSRGHRMRRDMGGS